MQKLTPTPEVQPAPASGFFEGERLELMWRYAYRSEFVPLLMNYLGARSGMHILEAGCGSGFLTRLLLRNLDNLRMNGIDSDAKLLDAAGQLLEREGLTDHVHLGRANAYRLPFPADTFDLVTSQTLL